MKLGGIDHVQLAMPVGQEERARAFYGGVLGLEEVSKPVALAARGGVWFVCAGIKVHLGVEDPFHPHEKAHTAFLVQDLTILKARFDRNACVFEPGVDYLERLRLYTRDPFGNRLEFIES